MSEIITPTMRDMWEMGVKFADSFDRDIMDMGHTPQSGLIWKTLRDIRHYHLPEVDPLAADLLDLGLKRTNMVDVPIGQMQPLKGSNQFLDNLVSTWAFQLEPKDEQTGA